MQFAFSTRCSDVRGHRVDWNSLYKETLAQCALADEVGFGRALVRGAHFLTGFSGSPVPRVISER